MASILRDDLELDEVDFLMRVEPEFVHVDHKLGLSYPLACAVYPHALELCRGLTSNSPMADVLDATGVLLVINANCQFAWNARKRALLRPCAERPASLQTELLFAAVVLTRHPKSCETWAHRYAL